MNFQRQNIYRQIGAKIAYYRKLTGITQEELAKRVQLHRTVITKIENGNYNDGLSIGTLLDIADALEVKPTMFLKFNRFERKLWDKYPTSQPKIDENSCEIDGHINQDNDICPKAYNPEDSPSD